MNDSGPISEQNAADAGRRGGLAISLLFLSALLLGPAAGAKDTNQPAGPNSSGSNRTHWSLQPLSSARPPVPRSGQPAQTPIDQFILARLEEHGLSMSPPADKPTLLRRVTFDLTGLPPTPAEAQAFLDDHSPAAFEKVVDRLLASPRYGERWARHWIDVVHFAETHGNDQDRIRTNAWPYRDYLIRSFNQDKSYRRFVEEQLAGDVLFPDDPQATIALGFIAAGPWDESSLRDIREDTIDRQIARYIDRDDMVTTTMSTFASTTAHCARCHDHKFDPISQEDYYSLQAVFAGVDRADRAYDPDPRRHLQRQQLLKKQRALEKKDPVLMASLLEPAFQSEVAAWEKNLGVATISWTVLQPVSFVSSNGTVLTKQTDGSLLASGTRPDKDTYVIEAQVDLEKITAVRLELLADETLPHRGPGRQDNGNMHLSEFKLWARPRAPAAASATDRGATNGPSLGTAIRLQRPVADFDQEGWTIAHALDRDEKTAWGIYPEVGREHAAIFELAEDLSFSPGTTLTFVLEQKHGDGHLIGRPRFSVTTAARPIPHRFWPRNIAEILAVPFSARTKEQQRDLAAYVLKEQLAAALFQLGKPKLIYAGANDFAPDGSHKPAVTPRPIHLLKRGDINKPGAEAKAGALSAVAALKGRFELPAGQREGDRRAALAAWLTAPENPLTWRSIVNRVWHYHFGRGMVDSPNDLGRMGGEPSHPELLDWLAGWFLEQGGSFKQLHKLILLSAVYQQASRENPAFDRLDAENRYLWRMNRARLDAESIHDAILQLAGQADLRMGGPSVQQFLLSPGIHVTPLVDYAKFDLDSPESRRRSIYRFLFRTLPDPFMDSLDCPEASQLAPVRSTSVTALQALSMLNNPFVVRQSEHFAERLQRAAVALPDQVEIGCRMALGHSLARAETAELVAYARKHGLANLCRLLLNSNQFMFVE